MILGSDAEQVARVAPVPVLLVRSAQKAAPGARLTEAKAPRARADEATAA
jgi:hypothetical protein